MYPFPKVTVVTVVYNAKDHLEKTIQSVIIQDFPKLEYIIIDGGSTDGSLDMIRRYESKIDYWVSEPDKGIFDAMNKSVKLANGSYINYMNAGDIFANEQVITKVFEKAPEGIDFIYGNHLVIYPNFTKYRKNLPMEQSWKMMPFSHQSLFVKTQIQKYYPFNENYPIVSDYDFIYNGYKNNYSFYDTQIMMVYFISGGNSEVDILRCIRQSFKIVRKRDKRLKIYIHYFSLYIKQYLIESLKKILPVVFFRNLMKLKNILQGKIRSTVAQ